jgi:hypothetical protein
LGSRIPAIPNLNEVILGGIVDEAHDIALHVYDNQAGAYRNDIFHVRNGFAIYFILAVLDCQSMAYFVYGSKRCAYVIQDTVRFARSLSPGS